MNIIERPRVGLVWSTPDPRRVVAVAARMTRSAMPVEDLLEGITPEEEVRSVNAVLEARHWSVFRHVNYCFTLSGVSRALSHQLVRHTIGHAYEQRSQHYRTERDPSYIMPPGIEGADRGSAELAYDFSSTIYDRLLDGGVSKEDARMVLPNGVETQLIWTANLEALMNFCRARACRVNCSEIISVAVQVRGIVIKTFPEMGRYLGPTCLTSGVCYEGKKFFTTCRHPWRVPTVLWDPDFPRSVKLVGHGTAVREFRGDEFFALAQPVETKKED